MKELFGLVTSSLSKIFGGRTVKWFGLLAARIRPNLVFPEPLGGTTRQLLSFLVSGSLKLILIELTIGMIDGKSHPFSRDSLERQVVAS